MSKIISFEASNASYYKIVLYCNGCIAVISFLISLWLTMKKSPKNFGVYKYFLLNITVTAFIYDFYMTVIYQPKILFPAVSQCPLGIMRYNDGTFPRIHLYFELFFIGANTVAVYSAFIYRYAAIRGILDTILSKKFLTFLVFLHLFHESPAILSYAIAHSETENIEKAILKEWPQIEPYFIGQGCCAMHFSVSNWPYYFLLSCVICFTIGLPIVFYLAYRTFTFLNTQKQSMSSTTYKMHKQLLYSLIFQLVIPTATIFIPFTSLAVFLIIQADNVVYIGQAMYIISTYHSLMNTMLMVFFIKPYREVIFKSGKFNTIKSFFAEKKIFTVPSQNSS